MVIQYASDLHLEFSDNKDFLKKNPLQLNGSILLLAGDIVPFTIMEKHKDFFKYVSDNFETTYWIPGNHEHYHFDVAKKSGIINEKIRENVFLVNNVTIKKDDVNFIFSTMWSKINPAHGWEIEKAMSDFQLIRYKNYRFSSDRFNELHDKSISFIKEELFSHRLDKTVVVTHHVPTFMHYPNQYKGDILNEAFAVELFDLIESEGPDYWMYGHHHQNTPSFKIGKTNLITNQLGYVKYKENYLFDTGKVFEL